MQINMYKEHEAAARILCERYRLDPDGQTISSIPGESMPMWVFYAMELAQLKLKEQRENDMRDAVALAKAHEPPMTDEQYKQAALILCAVWGKDPEEMVQAPSPRDGNAVFSVYLQEPYWASVVSQLKARDKRKLRELQIERALDDVRRK